MANQLKLRLTNLSIATVLIVCFQNCGAGWVSNVRAGGIDMLKSESLGDGSRGYVEFKNGLYAWAQQKNCTACHGSTIKPYFVNPDTTLAYNEAKAAGIVDFNNYASSVVISHSGNGHCNVATCTSATNPDELRPLVQAWAKAESSSNPATLPKLLTATLPLPATIPTTMVANPAILRFQLSGLGIPSLANAFIEVEVQMITPDFYRISRPKIAGNSAAVTVTGLHVFIKGPNDGGIGTADAEGMIWDDLNATADIFARPANLPATRIAANPLSRRSIQTPKKSMVDRMTLAFDDIK